MGKAAALPPLAEAEIESVPDVTELYTEDLLQPVERVRAARGHMVRNARIVINDEQSKRHSAGECKGGGARGPLGKAWRSVGRP